MRENLKKRDLSLQTFLRKLKYCKNATTLRHLSAFSLKSDRNKKITNIGVKICSEFCATYTEAGKLFRNNVSRLITIARVVLCNSTALTPKWQILIK